MEDIEQGDFIIEFYNSQSTWESISYTIDDNGDAKIFGMVILVKPLIVIIQCKGQLG